MGGKVPVSKERQRELREARKRGVSPSPQVSPQVSQSTEVSLIPMKPNVIPIGATEFNAIVTRLTKLEQRVSFLELAEQAREREAGLIRRHQKFNTPDFNPESW